VVRNQKDFLVDGQSWRYLNIKSCLYVLPPSPSAALKFVAPGVGGTLTLDACEGQESGHSVRSAGECSRGSNRTLSGQSELVSVWPQFRARIDWQFESAAVGKFGLRCHLWR
jgi:hypothetical protein